MKSVYCMSWTQEWERACQKSGSHSRRRRKMLNAPLTSPWTWRRTPQPPLPPVTPAERRGINKRQACYEKILMNGRRVFQKTGSLTTWMQFGWTSANWLPYCLCVTCHFSQLSKLSSTATSSENLWLQEESHGGSAHKRSTARWFKYESKHICFHSCSVRLKEDTNP